MQRYKDKNGTIIYKRQIPSQKGLNYIIYMHTNRVNHIYWLLVYFFSFPCLGGVDFIKLFLSLRVFEQYIYCEFFGEIILWNRLSNNKCLTNQKISFAFVVAESELYLFNIIRGLWK